MKEGLIIQEAFREAKGVLYPYSGPPYLGPL